jgi:hypothetical protein
LHWRRPCDYDDHDFVIADVRRPDRIELLLCDNALDLTDFDISVERPPR